MAKINNPPPQAPQYPWGAQNSVRERLVEPSQLDRKNRLRKKGNAKNPPLASTALLDFIGPAHSSDELRLPEPPFPPGHDADLDGFVDRPYLASVARRAEDPLTERFDEHLDQLQATPERKDRLKALHSREFQMLALVRQLHQDVREIDQRRREEQQGADA